MIISAIVPLSLSLSLSLLSSPYGETTLISLREDLIQSLYGTGSEMMKSEDEHSFIPLIAPHSSPSIVI
jgi:hypothetical protein